MKIKCDSRSNIRFVAILVIMVNLCHRTTGGSWRNLERLFVQDHRPSEHWDENRIFFPDMMEDPKPSEPPTSARPTDVTRRPCLDRCPVSREFSPVCGTNGVTYQNMAQLQCDIKCGVAVNVHKLSACSTNVLNASTSRRAPVVTSTAAAPLPLSAKDQEADRCSKACQTTPEYHPVCGTNFITYFNIGKLDCAKYCGVDVSLLRHSPCPKVHPTSTTNAPITDHDDVIKCVMNCPATPEYNPVCGTNHVTYNNIGKLECAKWCGVDVTVQKQGRCSLFSDPTPSPHHLSSTTSDEDYGEDNIDTRFRARHQKEFYWN